MSDQYTTVPNLAHLLELRVQRNPEEKIYRWLADGERESRSLSVADLYVSAKAIAHALQAMDRNRPRALLLYPPGLEFIEALFGCFCAGVVAVPAYPPRSRRDRPRIEAILRDSDCGAVLTAHSTFEDVSELTAASGQQVFCLATDQISPDTSAGFPPDRRQNETAYLQYSSGSTGAPKAAIITHENALANIRYLSDCIRINHDTTMVSWLPHFHDMGLMSGILPPLYWGCHSILLSPGAFIHRPVRWLAAISRYGGT